VSDVRSRDELPNIARDRDKMIGKESGRPRYGPQPPQIDRRLKTRRVALAHSL
jgi:hypothetical protein